MKRGRSRGTGRGRGRPRNETLETIRNEIENNNYQTINMTQMAIQQQFQQQNQNYSFNNQQFFNNQQQTNDFSNLIQQETTEILKEPVIATLKLREDQIEDLLPPPPLTQSQQLNNQDVHNNQSLFKKVTQVTSNSQTNAKLEECYRIIAQLNNQLNELRNINKPRVYVNRLDVNLIDENGNFVRLDYTSQYCPWCNHPINGIPFPLPEPIYSTDQRICISELMCSPNCAIAYNVKIIRDGRVHDRNALIYKLYRLLTGLTIDQYVCIKIAGPRKSLIIYGGDKTIEEFRTESLILTKETIEYIPPMKVLSVYIEEKNIIENKDGTKNSHATLQNFISPELAGKDIYSVKNNSTLITPQNQSYSLPSSPLVGTNSSKTIRDISNYYVSNEFS